MCCMVEQFWLSDEESVVMTVCVGRCVCVGGGCETTTHTGKEKDEFYKG